MKPFRSVMHMTQLITMLDAFNTYMVGHENTITLFKEQGEFRIVYSRSKRKNHYLVSLEQVIR